LAITGKILENGRELKFKGVWTMYAFKKGFFVASLMAALILMTGLDALGAENTVGSGSDEWWTVYPDQSSGAGGEVNHPSWVLDALENKPVMIYIHKDCSYCAPQTEAITKMANEYKGEITYFEIMGDGSDSRAEEALLAYDPNGGVSYVPMTIIVTLAQDSDGEVVPVWHSSEDITGEEWIKNYIEDAVSYHDDNSSS
jgi:hypothetical protein